VCGAFAPLAAAALLAIAAPPSGEPGAPLTNVDIVRMVMDRVPEKDIIRTIRESSATDFDLDPEILEELRAAGVTEPVLDAMKKAHKAASGPAPPPAEEPASSRLELRFEGDPNADAMTRTAVFFAADPNGNIPFTMALFVICVEPTHVPDFWQTKSPLGGGFPRHAMIWFNDATSPYETRRGMRGMDYIALDLPATVTVDVADGAVPGENLHSLALGIIVRRENEKVEEAWLLGEAKTPLRTLPGVVSRLTLAVSTRDAGITKRPQRDVDPHVIRVVSVEPDPRSAEGK